ncbi:MAG TPA: PVC-type heme-binding CxxCH protein [Opitutus sp.]|nr:PVC-type heme-binding CxxCH protein [Opitutus sp.]
MFTPLKAEQERGARFTTNGLHLSATGAARVADIVARALGANGLAPNAHESALQAAIAEKNRIWFECWRPANWSFAYGDRATQPYGRPAAAQPSLAEVFARHGALLATEDARIHDLVARSTTSAQTSDGSTAGNDGSMTGGSQALCAAEAMKTFTLADGFEVNLFADETLGVVKPTQIAWDERGRMFVGCSPTYPQPIPGVKPGDYILMLEDTNGDGVADRTSRFAEGLTMVLGLEPGAGGLYVCDYDQLVHLSDTDGDGRADRRTVVLSGFGVGDTHQLINSISHGPDGSLWFSQGLHAFSRVETPWGLTVLEKAGLWRFRPRTQRLDSFFNGGRAGFNCWGVAFDDYGQMFHKSGDRPAGYYSVPGLVRLPDPDEYHPTGALFSSPIKTTALEIVGTTAMPAEVQGCAVIAGYFGNVVELHRISDDGAGFQSEQLPKLLRSTSPDFRPVDVSVGPDGAIYVADWYNPVIGHYQASYADPQRDKTRGRIWRITAKDRPAAKLPNLHAMTAVELLEQLRSPERWTRYQAKRLLFDRDSSEVVPAADRWWRALDSSAPQFGLWLIEVAGIFQAHETPQPELVARLLGSPDPRVRAYGCRVVGRWADRLPNALALLSERIRDPHPRVRMEAVVACSEIRTTDAVAVLVRVVDLPRDRFIDYALTQALKALQPQWAPALAAGRLPMAAQPPYAEVFSRILNRETIADPAGKKSYDEFCLNCHQPDGRGLPEIYPPLSGSEWVSGDKETLIKIVLHGVSGPMTVAKKIYGKTDVVMPPAPLDDRQIADVLTYIRSSFGNGEDAVPIDLVRRVRTETSGRQTPWTEEELNARK